MHDVDDGRKFFNGKEETVPVEPATSRNPPNPAHSSTPDHELVCVAFIEGHQAKRTVSNLLPSSETHETEVNRRILVIP